MRTKGILSAHRALCPRPELPSALSDCFGEHLRSVEGFKQNPRYQGGGFPVAEHFNLPKHNQVHDMRVSVVRQVKGGMATLQREERRIIFQLGTLVPGGLNIDFKFF